MNCEYDELFNTTTDVDDARACQNICYKMGQKCKSFIYYKEDAKCKLFRSEQKTCKEVRGPPRPDFQKCLSSTR